MYVTSITGCTLTCGVRWLSNLYHNDITNVCYQYYWLRMDWRHCSLVVHTPSRTRKHRSCLKIGVNSSTYQRLPRLETRLTSFLAQLKSSLVSCSFDNIVYTRVLGDPSISGTRQTLPNNLGTKLKHSYNVIPAFEHQVTKIVWWNYAYYNSKQEIIVLVKLTALSSWLRLCMYRISSLQVEHSGMYQ